MLMLMLMLMLKNGYSDAGPPDLKEQMSCIGADKEEDANGWWLMQVAQKGRSRCSWSKCISGQALEIHQLLLLLLLLLTKRSGREGKFGRSTI